MYVLNHVKNCWNIWYLYSLIKYFNNTIFIWVLIDIILNRGNFNYIMDNSKENYNGVQKYKVLFGWYN